MKIHFIINPLSGGGNGQHIINSLLTSELLTPHHIFVHYTSNTDSILSILEEMIVPTIDRLIVIGGDGTLHHVLNTLHDLHIQMPIGYIPAGTGNDFMRGLQQKKSPLEYLDNILQSKTPTLLPVLKTNTFTAINSFGLGLDAQICHSVEKSTLKKLLNKIKLGSFIYVIHLIKALFSFKTFSITLDNLTFQRVAICTIMNNPFFGGGIQLDTKLQLTQPELSAIIVHNVTTLKMPSLLWALLRKKQLSHPCFYRKTFNTASLSVERKPLMQVDGEITHDYTTPIAIQMHTQLFWL